MTSERPTRGALEVRAVGPADAARAAELLTRFFSEEGFAVPPEGLEPRVRRYLALDRHRILAAHRGTRLVGVITVASGYSLEYGWVAEIEDLYVPPGERGRGLGRALVDAAARWAREDGCSAVLVTVTPEGQARHDLVDFYGRVGFADEGRRLMERRLG